jgi:alkaline phosphatase D
MTAKSSEAPAATGRSITFDQKALRASASAQSNVTFPMSIARWSREARDMGGQRSLSVVSRRRFLTGAAATVVGVAAGCSDGGDGSASSTTAPPATGGSTTSTTLHSARLAGDPFGMGVASGDPLPDSVMLWTRLAPDPVALDGLGAMAADPVDVVWEVATDDRFTAVVASGVFTAEPEHAHAVHVDVTGLEPATDYHYRFRVGEFTSPPGRTRTLPDGTPERFGLAVANCQWFEAGAYAAYRHMLDEEIDLILHLGDYIYEFAGNPGASGRSTFPDHPLADLTDYRLRYASYRLDADLRAAHARFPFALTWDDHEVANNYAGDTVPGGTDPQAVRDLKAAAYQAWWEHLPVRLDPPEDGRLVVRHDITVGDLARIYLLDERQDADVPPCRDTAAGDFGDCPERTAGDRSLLGADQESWFAEASSAGGVTWNVIGNPVCLAGIDGGEATGGPAYYLDSWDGFPSAQSRFIGQLAGIDNPVVLTGDYHQGMVLEVRERPFDQSSALVATEFMAPPISSVLFGQDVSGRTPQLRQQFDDHGYLVVDIEPERLTARFRILADGADPASAISTGATWEVTPGDPDARQA